MLYEPIYIFILILNVCSVYAIMILYFKVEKNGCNFCLKPSFYRKRVLPMTTAEVLTLVLVIFAALSYIDNKQKKK